MLKYSSFILLAAVAISVSCANGRVVHTAIKRGVSRIIRDTSDANSEFEEALVKELFAGVLLLTAQTSAERSALEEKFREAVDKKWDSVDDYAAHLVKVYEEVTGRKPEDNELFQNSSDSSE